MLLEGKEIKLRAGGPQLATSCSTKGCNRDVPEGMIVGILCCMSKLDPSHTCHADFTDEQEAHFPIIYARADMFTHSSRRSAKKVFFGICGFTHRIFRIHSDNGGSTLQMMMVDDLIIKDGKCEMEKYCLARECPLNHTPDSSIKKQLHKQQRPREFDITPLTGARHCEWFKAHPEGGLI